MLRNYLAASLRNLVRNRLYALINIAGLAVAIAAALLIALFVRDEFNHDTWIPDHERVSLMTSGDGGGFTFDIGPPVDLAPSLTLDFPFLEAAARFLPAEISLRRGTVEANEHIFWADSGALRALPLPVIAGNPQTALERPDSIVVTRAIARKYFGRDDAVGGVLDINRTQPMTVTAVLEDLPPNTDLDVTVLASAQAALSPLAKLGPNSDGIGAYTFVRLKPGADAAAFRNALPDFIVRHRGGPMNMANGKHLAIFPVPIAKLHLSPPPPFNAFLMKPRGSLTAVIGMSAIGGLILLVACINFINLMTAWAGRRAAEVGVRKVSGAERRDLIAQFIGEALLYVAFSTALGAVLAQLLSPALQAFLGRAAPFQYWRDPPFIAGVAGFTVALGIMAGAYPAFVLSAFKPASVLKTNIVRGPGSGALRRILATLQFAVLIALIAAAGTISSQLHFALNEGMRIATDQMLTVTTSCTGPFADQVRALPGVRAAACSHSHALDRGGRIGTFNLPDGSRAMIGETPVAPGFLEMYGLRPLAGRFFAEGRADDVASGKPVVVINETAMRRFGFAAPDAALGQSLPFAPADAAGGAPKTAEVIGVVPDFSLDAVGTVVSPMFFYSDASAYGDLNIKLSGRDIPETLAAIDGLWKDTGEPRPIKRVFVDQRLEELYRNIVRQGQVFAAFAGVAVFIAVLGLFGLAAFTAERRTKEIGVRKALGASRRDILGLLVWEFAQPVIWANVLAWPIGYLAMQRWLEGFAHHVAPAPWVFLGASASALLVAVLTVLGHALMVAHAEPVKALRYE